MKKNTQAAKPQKKKNNYPSKPLKKNKEEEERWKERNRRNILLQIPKPREIEPKEANKKLKNRKPKTKMLRNSQTPIQCPNQNLNLQEEENKQCGTEPKSRTLEERNPIKTIIFPNSKTQSQKRDRTRNQRNSNCI